jgi:glycosyltransferase involved in cell wall biosynthesis
MQLSIIISTINREKELEALLASIEKHVKNVTFEVIIIDQNPPGFLDDVILKFKENLKISHHLVAFRGLSKAKNYGAKIAKGEYFTFPDDDCMLLSNTYFDALEILQSQSFDIVFGRCIDSKGQDSVMKFKKESTKLNTNNMFGGFVEATGVIHKSVFDKGFYFDEKMGVGCFHGAEEGYDWLYRILTSIKSEVFYSTKIIFLHPQVLIDKGSKFSLKRVFTYSCGKAYLCKKHKFYAMYIKRLVLVSMSIPLYLLINPKKAKYYISELLGLISGFIIE